MRLSINYLQAFAVINDNSQKLTRTYSYGVFLLAHTKVGFVGEGRSKKAGELLQQPFVIYRLLLRYN